MKFDWFFIVSEYSQKINFDSAIGTIVPAKVYIKIVYNASVL